MSSAETQGRGKAAWPFHQMAMEGRLGLSEPANRAAYFAGCRLRSLLNAVRGDAAESQLGAEGDGSRWNVYRDLPAQALAVHRKQELDLAADVLEDDFPLLCAVIDRNWTARAVGETEGFADRVTASAAGHAMIRCAMRKLVTFFEKLDHLQASDDPEEFRRTWPLVGTPAWPFEGIPRAWNNPASATAARPAANDDCVGWVDGRYRPMARAAA